MINAPLRAAHQTLINVDKRPERLAGNGSINNEMMSERISMRHNCVFRGMTLINTAIYRDFSEDHALYSERVEMPDIGLTIVVYYDLYPQDDGSRRAEFQRVLDGGSTASRKQAGHDGCAGRESRAF